MESPTYHILEHIQVLTPSKGSKTKYHCPVCNGDDLDISKDGAYSCFSGNCEPKDIRLAIDKLEGKPEWKPVEDAWVKQPRLKSHKDYFYPDLDGNNLVKVTRKDDGNGKKTFPQSHWDGGKWVSGNPAEVKKLIPIYRYAEVKDAIERRELIFIVEGESTADALWGLGIAATTTIGGSSGYSKYGNYTEDLKGARLILAPDRDTNGIKHISNFTRDFTSQIEGYYLAGSAGLWQNPQGGMDIGDDIQDHKYTAEQILAHIITADKYQEAIAPKANTEKKTATNSRFTSSVEGGLVKSSFDEDGTEKGNPEDIGNHLTAIACVDNPEQDGAALLLEFKTFKGDIRRWTMLRAYLAGDGSAIAEGLLSRGYNFKRKQKGSLLDYIQGLGAEVGKTYTVVDSTGWVNGRYIGQHKTYGDGDYVFQQVESSSEVATEIKGTLEDWQNHVGAKCDNNSRLIFILGVGFAAPLLEVVGLESGGFHLMGDTSTGKTTAVKVAVSVTGEKEIPNWRTTANGLEMTATAHNHSMLPLDEIGQADEKGVGEACYMLRNGQGKSRSTKDLKARKVKTWRLVFLSTGEHSLSSYMAMAGKVQKGGQEVGMPDIPAVPFGSPYGVFESIHGCDSSKEFAENLEAACLKYRGTAIDKFLTQLVIDRQDKSFDGAIAARVFKAAKRLAEGTTDLAVSRVANRFALLQVALELAHSYDILPFPVDRIEWAVKKMFADWLTQRGGDGSIEIKAACDRIEHLLVTNEFSRRIFTLPNNDGLKADNLLAYRKVGLEGHTEEFWVPTSVFDKEFVVGVNKPELVKELQRLGCLLPPRPDGKAIRIRKINNQSNYYYVFGKRENVSDTRDTRDTDTSNPLSATVPLVSLGITYPKTESDTRDTYINIQDVGITGITEVSPPSDTSTTLSNRLKPTVSGEVSRVSRVSPQKTTEPIEEDGGIEYEC